MLGSRHEIARLQSDFYRDQFRRSLRWLMYAVVIIFILLGMVAYAIFFRPVQRYYGNTSDGQILLMPPAVIKDQHGKQG